MNIEISRALAPYGLDDARVRLLARHTNTMYRVDAAGECYVFRVSAPGLRTEREIASELAWLSALRKDTDLLVPEAVATRSGRRLVRVGSGTATVPGVLFRWIDGRIVGDRVTPALVREAGALLASLHDHADRFRPRGAFSETRLDRAWTFGVPAALEKPGRVAGWPKARRTLLREAAARVQAWLGELYAEPSGLRFLHLDFHPGNWKRVDGRLAALDFDDSRWAHPAQDLGIALYYLLDGPAEPVLMGAFLDGYARVRPSRLPEAEELQTAIIMRQIDLVSYVLAQRLLTGTELTRWLGVVETRLHRLMK